MTDLSLLASSLEIAQQEAARVGNPRLARAIAALRIVARDEVGMERAMVALLVIASDVGARLGSRN